MKQADARKLSDCTLSFSEMQVLGNAIAVQKGLIEPHQTLSKPTMTKLKKAVQDRGLVVYQWKSVHLWRVTPFGLTNAPAIMQRLIDRVLARTRSTRLPRTWMTFRQGRSRALPQSPSILTCPGNCSLSALIPSTDSSKSLRWHPGWPNQWQ